VPFPGSTGLFCRDPLADARFEDVERQGAAAENLVVKPTDIKGGAQLPPGIGAEGLELQLTHLVRQSLAGPADGAVNLDDDVVLGLAGVLLLVKATSRALFSSSAGTRLRTCSRTGSSTIRGNVTFLSNCSIVAVGMIARFIGIPYCGPAILLIASHSEGNRWPLTSSSRRRWSNP
jgi:hypothetical protein